MSDTKVLTLSREFRIYEDDTSLAPLAIIPVPASVGASDGDATEHLIDVADSSGIDLQVVTATLFKTVTYQPTELETAIFRAWTALGTKFRQVGVSIWAWDDDSEAFLDMPHRVYYAAQVPTGTTSYDSHVQHLSDDVNALINDDYDLSSSGVYELNCGNV